MSEYADRLSALEDTMCNQIWNANELRDALEETVDRIGLASTIANLIEIAYLKAEHLRENWQDEGMAKSWDHDAKVLDRIESKLNH